jgi:hypothetical protein
MKGRQSCSRGMSTVGKGERSIVRRSPTTHSTRRLDSIPFIVDWFLHADCFMLGAG